MSDAARQHDPQPVRVHVAGSDAPERQRLRIGFLPLVDCAPLVVASVLGLDRRRGVAFELSREPSWAAVRDGLLGGTIDLAHAMLGLVYGVQTGVGGLQREMAVLATINRNGQGIGLSRAWFDRGATDAASLATLVGRHRDPGGAPPTFAVTYPTGTHAMWLAYWLAAAGVDPSTAVRTIVVPPAQMVPVARSGRIAGFCVGAPWNRVGAAAGVSVEVAASHDVWPDHPEKVLAATAEFVDGHPHACRAAVAAMLDAARWIEASDDHRRAAAAIVAGDDFVAADRDLVAATLAGGPGALRFFDDGDVGLPWLSDGVWFMTQHKRWGLLAQHPDYADVARRVQRVALYRDAAADAGVAVPAASTRSSRLIDGRVWDGSDPRGYADGFALPAASRRAAGSDRRAEPADAATPVAADPVLPVPTASPRHLTRSLR